VPLEQKIAALQAQGNLEGAQELIESEIDQVAQSDPTMQAAIAAYRQSMAGQRQSQTDTPSQSPSGQQPASDLPISPQRDLEQFLQRGPVDISELDAAKLAEQKISELCGIMSKAELTTEGRAVWNNKLIDLHAILKFKDQALRGGGGNYERLLSEWFDDVENAGIKNYIKKVPTPKELAQQYSMQMEDGRLMLFGRDANGQWEMPHVINPTKAFEAAKYGEESKAKKKTTDEIRSDSLRELIEENEANGLGYPTREQLMQRMVDNIMLETDLNKVIQSQPQGTSQPQPQPTTLPTPPSGPVGQPTMPLPGGPPGMPPGIPQPPPGMPQQGQSGPGVPLSPSPPPVASLPPQPSNITGLNYIPHAPLGTSQRAAQQSPPSAAPVPTPGALPARVHMIRGDRHSTKWMTPSGRSPIAPPMSQTVAKKEWDEALVESMKENEHEGLGYPTREQVFKKMYERRTLAADYQQWLQKETQGVTPENAGEVIQEFGETMLDKIPDIAKKMIASGEKRGVHVQVVGYPDRSYTNPQAAAAAWIKTHAPHMIPERVQEAFDVLAKVVPPMKQATTPPAPPVVSPPEGAIGMPGPQPGPQPAEMPPQAPGVPPQPQGMPSRPSPPGMPQPQQGPIPGPQGAYAPRQTPPTQPGQRPQTRLVPPYQSPVAMPNLRELGAAYGLGRMQVPQSTFPQGGLGTAQKSPVLPLTETQKPATISDSGSAKGVKVGDLDIQPLNPDGAEWEKALIKKGHNAWPMHFDGLEFVPIIMSEKERNELPTGTRYMDPMGNIHKKGESPTQRPPKKSPSVEEIRRSRILG
jgi:hypothetical protein